MLVVRKLRASHCWASHTKICLSTWVFPISDLLTIYEYVQRTELRNSAIAVTCIDKKAATLALHAQYCSMSKNNVCSFPCCCDLANINLPNTVIQLPRCQNHKTGCKKATTERERHATPRSDISCHPEYVQQIFGIQPCSNMHWQESSHTACPILFTDQKQCVFFFVFLCCCDLTNINFRSRDQTPLFSFHGVKTTKPVARKPPQRESATGSFRNQPSVTFGCGMPHRPDCCTRLLNCKKSHFVRKVSLQQLTFKP